MIDQVVSAVNPDMIMDWAKGNQGSIAIAGWVTFIVYALFRTVRKVFGGNGEFDYGRVGNSLQLALSGSGWRWGKEDGKPSGKSIVLDRADGSRLVANFKTGKYFLTQKVSKIDPKTGKNTSSEKESELNGLMTKKQVKKLNVLRDKAVANLKATDVATAKADKARKDNEVTAALENFGRRI